jgi:hypothetical protein
LRSDGGFEDREDHQAPVTLRNEKKENAERSTFNAQRPIAETLTSSTFGVRRSAFGVF